MFAVTTDTDLIQKLESNLREASLNLSKSVGPGPEVRYTAAYQALVKVGLRPQIRAKYRGGK